MKRIFAILIFALTVNGKAQSYVTIPDTAFAACLRAYFPTAMNGNQLDTGNILIKEDTNIYAVGWGIVNLQGIQYFHSLKVLQCSSNQLTSLPPLPNSLRGLDCSFNQLTTLPALPKLQTLSCYKNQLTNLPVLSNLITYINCGYNFITSLPALPPQLTWLDCSDNLITYIPTLPTSLKNLRCSHNQLTELPVLPDSLQLLDCTMNNISCFPSFPNTLTHIFIFKNLFTCLPNYVNAMSKSLIPSFWGQSPLTYPLCSLDNTNGCPASTDVPTQIIIPNIFTPNNDSVNDTFFVKGANLSNFSCIIYNRWGNELYKWSDITTGWNGKDKNGTTYDDGTYYYIVTYTDNTGKTQTQKGFVQLVR